MGTIYIIRSMINGAEYIGSASGNRVTERWRRHRTDLRAGIHHSLFLQRAWDKYGEDSFEFLRVEEVLDDLLLDAEQKYLDDRKGNFPRYMTYNILWNSRNCSGRKVSAKTKKKLSESHMGNKRSLDSVAKQKSTFEEHFKKPYSLMDNNGDTYQNIHSFRGFSRDHGLEANCVRLLVSGKIRQHRGWTVLGAKIKKYSLISPDGIRFDDILLLKNFCLTRGLPYKQIHKLFRGDRVYVGGWKKG